MSYKEFAERELRAIGYYDAEDNDVLENVVGTLLNSHMIGDVLQLLDVFSEQGHSGGSAPICVRLFSKLALFEPLSPLTGEDDEWNDVSEASGKPLWQNKRCGTVFKDEDGRAYDINGRVFREPNGVTYTSNDSLVFVEFPYTPKTQIINVLAVEP